MFRRNVKQLEVIMRPLAMPRHTLRGRRLLVVIFIYAMRDHTLVHLCDEWLCYATTVQPSRLIHFAIQDGDEPLVTKRTVETVCLPSNSVHS